MLPLPHHSDVCCLAQQTKQKPNRNSKAKGVSRVSPVIDDTILASIDPDGKSPWLSFHSNHLTPLSGTPKRQRGRRAQQARAVVAAAAAAATTATTATITTLTTATITATTTTPTPDAATGSLITGNTTADITTPTRNLTRATVTAGVVPVDDDNPFLASSLYGQLVEPISCTEWPSRASQLEEQLRTLSICSPASRRANHMSPEVSPVRQKGRKDAQDVRAFFRQVNDRWNCKFCEYVFHFHLSRTLIFLTYSP